MAIPVTMPRLSDTMQEGTLNKWHVKAGDPVKSGDVLADVETDKATMELQSYDDGTVARLAVEEGQTVPVGKLILVLAGEGESVEQAAQAPVDESAPDAPAAPAATPAAAPAAAPTPHAAPSAAPSRAPVSPLARKIAQEKGVDVGALKGSGPGGRIVKRDVLEAASDSARPGAAGAGGITASPAAPVGGGQLEARTVPLTSMRKTIARRLVESKTTIPHFTVTLSVHMDELLALRQTLNRQLESQQVKLSVNDFIVRAAALALVQHPVVNSSFTGEGLRLHGTVNMGVAVALPQEKGGGLVVPVIRDCQNKGLRTISAESRAFSDKARGRGLSAEEMSDGTFTVTNLGMFGVDHFEGIINPPQTAILAVGSAMPRPVVRDGQVVVAQEMTLTLSADHRAVDGATAAAYLNTLKQLLENPAVLLV